MLRNLIGLCLCVLLLSPLRTVAEDVGVVREILISGNERTRTEVILRELLFKPGEMLTEALVEETSRNLRALLFLGEVQLDVHRDNEYADVRVTVVDFYARAITPLLSGEPGELSYGAVGLDYNFAGRGQIIELTAEHDAVTGNRFRAFFREPRWAGSRVRTDVDVEVSSEGHRVALAVAKPFFRLSETWSTGVSGISKERIQRLYSGHTLSSKYVETIRSGSLSISKSYGNRSKIRPGVFVSVTDRSFTAESGFVYAPPDRRRVLPSIGLTLWVPKYETTRFFRRLGRTEDLQTGSWATVRVGASVEGLGSDRDYRFLTLDVNPRHKLNAETTLLTRFTYRSRFSDGRVWNVFASADAILHVKIREVQAIAARVRWDGLARTEDVTQYLLGPGQGLRGYALRRFDGSKRLFFNVEGRPTLLRREQFTLAGVAFLDGGAAWSESGDRDLALAAGGGVRLGMNEVYNSPVLRADLGYGFRDRSWVLYVGLGQYF